MLQSELHREEWGSGPPEPMGPGGEITLKPLHPISWPQQVALLHPAAISPVHTVRKAFFSLQSHFSSSHAEVSPLFLQRVPSRAGIELVAQASFSSSPPDGLPYSVFLASLDFSWCS